MAIAACTCIGAFAGSADAQVPPPDLSNCPPVDLHIIMDTSGSMDDEAAALLDHFRRDERFVAGHRTLRLGSCGFGPGDS